MTANQAKARLRRGEIALGTMVSEMRNEEVAYILAAAGFDFCVIDTEHGSANWDDLVAINRIVAGRPPLTPARSCGVPSTPRSGSEGSGFGRPSRSTPVPRSPT